MAVVAIVWLCVVSGCGFSASLGADAGVADDSPRCNYTVTIPGSSSRYALPSDSLAWRLAETSCEAQGAHLVVPSTPAELAMLPPGGPRWIGIAQMPQQPTPAAGWFDVTGRPAAVTWSDGMPDDAGGGENAAEQAVAQGPAGLEDRDHRAALPYVCECDGQQVSASVVNALPP